MQIAMPLRANVEIAAIRPYIKFLAGPHVNGQPCFKNVHDIHEHYPSTAKYQQAMAAAFYKGRLNTVLIMNLCISDFHISSIN